MSRCHRVVLRTSNLPHESQMPMYVRISLQHAIGLCAVCLLFGFAVLAFAIVITTDVDDAYAQHGAASMIIAYLKEHEDKWPSGWSALKPYFMRGKSHVGGWSFQQFQDRICIDFSANTDDLKQRIAESNSVNIELVKSRHWWPVIFDKGPDEEIVLYLRSRIERPAEE